MTPTPATDRFRPHRRTAAILAAVVAVAAAAAAPALAGEPAHGTTPTTAPRTSVEPAASPGPETVGGTEQAAPTGHTTPLRYAALLGHSAAPPDLPSPAPAPAPAPAEEVTAPGDDGLDWRPLGLLRIRDLTPFGILRLDMLPAHAVSAEPGTFAVEANLSYQNTYVLSDNVEDYLRSRDVGPTGRASLSQQDVDAILALPQDAYFVDGEFGLLDLTLHWFASERWAFYATMPYLYFDGGFLDDTIEDFHANFGFSTAARDLVVQNRFQVVASIDGESFVLRSAPDSDFGDPVFGARWSRFARPESWNLVLEGAAKVPLWGEERLVSTGAVDLGVQATVQRFWDRSALHLSLSGVYYDAPQDLPGSREFVPTAILGWERGLSRRTSAIVQLYASPSVVDDTTAEELAEDKYQVTLGIQTWRGDTAYRFGITENVSNFSNTPDIGFTFQVGRVLTGRVR